MPGADGKLESRRAQNLRSQLRRLAEHGSAEEFAEDLQATWNEYEQELVNLARSSSLLNLIRIGSPSRHTISKASPTRRAQELRKELAKVVRTEAATGTPGAVKRRQDYVRLFRLYEKEMIALTTSDSMGDLLEANSPSTLGTGLADAMGL